MEIVLVESAENDFLYWKNSGNLKIQKKIEELLKNISLTPEYGLGKPEKLKHHLSGFWSRRINNEHRIIYQIDLTANKVFIHSLKGHY